MRILSEAEGRDWLLRAHIDTEKQAWEGSFGKSASFALPVDTGMKTGLAKFLCEFAGTSSETVLWIRDWGIFLSSENVNLFYGFRKSLGESRSLKDAPFHLLSVEELPALESLIALVLYFFWDAVLINVSRGIYVELSHDEIMELRMKDSILLEKAGTTLQNYGLQPA